MSHKNALFAGRFQKTFLELSKTFPLTFCFEISAFCSTVSPMLLAGEHNTWWGCHGRH